MGNSQVKTKFSSLHPITTTTGGNDQLQNPFWTIYTGTLAQDQGRTVTVFEFKVNNNSNNNGSANSQLPAQQQSTIPYAKAAIRVRLFQSQQHIFPENIYEKAFSHFTKNSKNQTYATIFFAFSSKND